MELSTNRYRRCDLVRAAGRIDSDTAPQLREAIEAITKDGRYRIVFDMSEVGFISSAGVWVLLDTQKTCKRYNRGEVVIANVNENIKHTLDLAGLIHYFKFFDDVTAAVGSF
jgi:anti-sigma B factor antagonist